MNFVSFSDLWCVLFLFYLTHYNNLANLSLFLEPTLSLCKLSVLLQEFTLLSLDFWCLSLYLTMSFSIPFSCIQTCIEFIMSHLRWAHAQKDAGSVFFPLLGILPQLKPRCKTGKICSPFPAKELTEMTQRVAQGRIWRHLSFWYCCSLLEQSLYLVAGVL